MRIAIVSGGFDPLHPGHTRMFAEAKAQADMLIVGINSDEWLIRKKGKFFQPWAMRQELVIQNQNVDTTESYNDDDGTSNDLLVKVRDQYPDASIVFCNGGDRVSGNVPEETTAKKLGIELVWGVGGDDKYSSSSTLLERWAKPMYNRPWGKFYILAQGEDYQVKELIVDCDKELSEQYHHHRDEVWQVIEGTAQLLLKSIDGSYLEEKYLAPGDYVSIPKLMIHKLYNPGKIQLRLIEIQKGKYLAEDDIVRLDKPDGY